jgi:phenylpropionate dioxygenase-like ring-hydroxylating dioxygenase large terminal subunit
MALDGGQGSRRGRPAMAGMTAQDERRIDYYILWPLAFLSIHPDYLLVHRMIPQGPARTLVTCDWLFEPSTMAMPDFDPSDAVAFWDLTNTQDWHVCELQQRGTRSSSWVAGRYSNQEFPVHNFDRMVVDRYVGDPFWSTQLGREREGQPVPTADGALTNGTNGYGRGGDLAAKGGARKGARSRATAPR